MKYIVYHQGYGCETGCCGHIIYKVPDNYNSAYPWQEDTEEVYDSFDFDHPYVPDAYDNYLNWAKNFLSKALGDEHVKDLDWEHSLVLDD